MPVEVSEAVVVSKGDGGAMGARDNGLDSASTEGKQGEVRETMVYEGSVRSGQQVGGGRCFLILYFFTSFRLF